MTRYTNAVAKKQRKLPAKSLYSESKGTRSSAIKAAKSLAPTKAVSAKAAPSKSLAVKKTTVKRSKSAPSRAGKKTETAPLKKIVKGGAKTAVKVNAVKKGSTKKQPVSKKR